MGIRVKVHDRQLVGALRRARRRCEDMSLVWEDIGTEVVDSIQATFDAEGRPTTWEPWSKKYGEWRDKVKPGKILEITGMGGGLMGSINYQAHQSGVRIGTNKEYAAIHNFGGKMKRGGTMPQREFLVVQDSDWPKFAAIVEEHIIGDLNG